MILSKEEIFKILEDNPNKDLISKAVHKHKLLNMHVNGVGVKEHLASLKDYETKLQTEVGQKIVESNKGLFNALLHPVSKVFSAKGGSKRHDLPTYSTKQFKNLLSNVAHGLSVRKWLEKKIFNKYITDPNGVLFIEVSNNEATPTFKSITSVYDYLVIGQKVEYIVFKPEKIDDDSDKLYYRVVDDAFDYYIEADKKDEKTNFSILEDKTFPVHFKSCPAFVVSDIFNDVIDVKSSFVEPTLEKANSFLYDNAVHTKHKLLFGFAKYWEYGRDCVPCNGDGVIQNKDTGNYEKCSFCEGTGRRPFGDVTDKLILDLPQSKDDLVLDKYSGFDTPDLQIWKQYKEDLKDHEQSLFRILWNINYLSEQTTKTATQSTLEVQPINDKLHSVSDNFEKLETFVTESLGYFYYEDAYKGSSINYGRRYLIESPDAIWNKLTTAKEKKMPVVFLINLTKEYIQSLYANNEIESSIQMKLLSIEPFLFMTIDEVIGLSISEEDKKRKIYFQEWLQSKNDTELLLKSKESLITELTEFINQKSLTNETQQVQGTE